MQKLNGNKWVVPILAFVLFSGMLECGEKPQVKQELNLLCWVGYEESTMVEPFEKKFNVRVNCKTFVGGDRMFALFTQSKGILLF